MKAAYSWVLCSLAIYLSACASFQSAGEISQGRQAFLIGNNEAALAHFQRAAQIDPNYVYGTPLRQGVWSYVGRSEYATGRLAQARRSLERALATNRHEDIARLYLGMTLAREGDQQRGLQEITDGMRGIHSWIDNVAETLRFSTGKFWDPQRHIRSDIQTTLAMTSTPSVDWEKVLAGGERIGKAIEAESDRALSDEVHEISRMPD